MSQWREIYRRFVDLERSWQVHDHPGVNRQLFRSAVLSRRGEAAALTEFASFGLPQPPGPLWEEARALSAALDFPHRGRHLDDPCDDVYQAALTMLPHGEWTASDSLEKLFRGQRDAMWTVVPSFFRVPAPEREDRQRRLGEIAEALMAEAPSLSLDQALALIQHYSVELDAPTWLLDVTWDPAVALLFASLGGQAGDLGVVTMLVRREWDRLSADGRNRLGQIHLIEVPGALRIERQRALFLDTSHPDLVEQYVAHSVWFRQVERLVFEDVDADLPVSVKTCFPDDDPTLELIRDLRPARIRCGGAPVVAPPSDASAPLEADDYLSIAASWCEERGVVLDAPHHEILVAVSRFHAALQRHRDCLAIDLRSLHRLRDGTDQVIRAQEDGEPIDVISAVRLTRCRQMTPDEADLIDALTAEAGTAAGDDAGSTTELPAFIMSVLDDLPDDLGELVVIGVAEDTDERVTRDVEVFLADARLRVFDVRGAADVVCVGALATEVGQAVRVLLVNGASADAWLRGLTRAALNGDHRIEFAQGFVERPPGMSIVIVYYGAADISELPECLAEQLIVLFL